MGRPLNKKYFGNRNIGTGGDQTTGGLSNSQNYNDDRIGGEGIAGFTWSDLGSFAGNSNVAPITIPALPAPTLPGGVQATWTMLFEVFAVTTGAGKTDLAVGDTFGVASIPGMIAKVTDLSGANAVFSVTTTGASPGTALALADIPQDTIGITLTKIAGTGTAATFLTDISFHIKQSTITITEEGSGYTGAETFTFTKPGTTSGNVPAGTIVLTEDNGVPYSAGNNENAIKMYANITGSGSTGALCDIIKQVSTRRYKVTDGTNVGIAELSTDATPADGYGYIVATSTGGTYYVTKLTAHKATLVAKTGDEALDGQQVQWTFGSATDVIVQIENA